MFSTVREPHCGSMCSVSIGMCLHKGGTRWNNAIFEEEESKRRRGQIATRKKKEGSPTTEGREKNGETERRCRERREEEDVEKSDGLPAQNGDATSLSVTIVWMSSRSLESPGSLNALRAHRPKRARRRKSTLKKLHRGMESE